MSNNGNDWNVISFANSRLDNKKNSEDHESQCDSSPGNHKYLYKFLQQPIK